MLVFEEGGKPENPAKNPQSKGENQQQTQSTYDAGSGNRTRVTLVGGERCHHCAIPESPIVFVGETFTLMVALSTQYRWVSISNLCSVTNCNPYSICALEYKTTVGHFKRAAFLYLVLRAEMNQCSTPSLRLPAPCSVRHVHACSFVIYFPAKS